MIVMIDKYLVSNCLFIIDEFNEMYKGISNEELKEIANREYSEADLVVRLGYPFRQMATFNMQGSSKEFGNDIVVKSKNYKIEVKLLRNWKSKGKTEDNFSNSMPWDHISKDFEWISNEVVNGNQGNRAFVIGWFNAVERFSNIVQLGKGRGRYPDIALERLDYFPFLHRTGLKTNDVTYQYSLAYQNQSIKIPGYLEGTLNCMFFGQPEDKFHLALYW